VELAEISGFELSIFEFESDEALKLAMEKEEIHGEVLIPDLKAVFLSHECES
jgi:hypothetical protein